RRFGRCRRRISGPSRGAVLRARLGLANRVLRRSAGLIARLMNEIHLERFRLFHRFLRRRRRFGIWRRRRRRRGRRFWGRRRHANFDSPRLRDFFDLSVFVLIGEIREKRAHREVDDDRNEEREQNEIADAFARRDVARFSFRRRRLRRAWLRCLRHRSASCHYWDCPSGVPWTWLARPKSVRLTDFAASIT